MIDIICDKALLQPQQRQDLQDTQMRPIRRTRQAQYPETSITRHHSAWTKSAAAYNRTALDASLVSLCVVEFRRRCQPAQSLHNKQPVWPAPTTDRTTTTGQRGKTRDKYTADYARLSSNRFSEIRACDAWLNTQKLHCNKIISA